MNNFCKILLVVALIFLFSCGKKTSLDRFPGSDYPRQYPKENE